MQLKKSFFQWVRALLSVVLDVFLQKWRNRNMPPASKLCHSDVRGKTCIVTGPTSGIGLETARELAMGGAHVVLACRNTSAGWKLVQQWQRDVGDEPGIKAEVMFLDLSSLSSVRAFGESWHNKQAPIHLLINNAGIFSMGGGYDVTEEGFESHLGVNHLAHALLTLVLLPSLIRGAPSRVVSVGSHMHELADLDLTDLNFSGGQRKYSPTGAYSQSKLCQIMFSNALLRRLPQKAGVDVVSVNPGEVMTNVVRTLPRVMQKGYFMIMPMFCLTACEGARSVLHVATNPAISVDARATRTLRHLDGPYYGSDGQLAAVSPFAVDLTASDKLWAITLQMVGLNPDVIERALGGMTVTASAIAKYVPTTPTQRTEAISNMASSPPTSRLWPWGGAWATQKEGRAHTPPDEDGHIDKKR